MMRFVLCMLACALAVPAAATEAGWALLRNGGQIVLLRHAAAPGTGDPANFDISKCGTQRNLSDRGKQQAEKIGALIAARAGYPERVLTSRYCRARDTARIAFEDVNVEEFAALDELPKDEAAARTANEAVLAEIAGYTGSGNFILVTHVENIKALTGISPREGEAVIVTPSDTGVRVAARIVFN